MSEKEVEKNLATAFYPVKIEIENSGFWYASL